MASINPSDLVTISGAYGSRISLPFVPGYEGVVVVESVSDGVSESKVGQRVLPLGSSGTWQDVKVTEKLVTGKESCSSVPSDLTDEQAAMAYINPLTAQKIVEKYAPKKQDTIVAVNAATSAIGQILIRMLNKKGLEPVVLVRRSDAGEQLMRELDVAAVICSSEEASLPQKLYELTRSRGLAVAFNAVGGSEGDDLVRTLSPKGVLVHNRLLSGRALSYELLKECPWARIELFRLRDWARVKGHDEVQSALDEIFEMIRDGTVATKVAGVCIAYQSPDRD
ncbi:related to NADPH:quinone reductase and related Zn-dependent oxidoreductases [Fusarium mangiferae]|uniref:Related to NADPH:quinone reductase and related Zn-dependent oxidoreductases n=1 Tax=Fusarium mangiferae TaxID=192010 RepID=A0A1L7UCP3_FUSMA|nr:related to NADPH:quinone reductase and related Zn-dependent oxidoreductases [Fusarium mangiferae]CVL05281.1 related to NADPH:quinone reductase and related Zn-dependent oxidoreductases [Fusarium mangiferae]